MSDIDALYTRLTKYITSPTAGVGSRLHSLLTHPLPLACITTFAAGVFSYLALSTLFTHPIAAENMPSTHRSEQTEVKEAESIYIDLSGAVVNPRTYRVSPHTRLYELIDRAGGLSKEADFAFVQRNYNFAVLLSDQQKVHIPSVFEVRDGFFSEKQRLVSLQNNTTTDLPGLPLAATAVDGKISLNQASQSQLESLSGVGAVTASRIIAGRPYRKLEELVDRDIIKDTLFQKIQSQLAL